MVAPALALALVATSGLAKDRAPPAPATPTGPWRVQVEESMCLLQRTYPVGNKTITLVFQPLLDTGQMELYILSNGSFAQQQFQGRATARVASSQQKYAARYFSVWASPLKARLTRLSTAREVLDGLQDGDTLTVEAKPVNVAFRIVRPDKAREALRTCIADLKKSWGIDDTAASRAVTPLEGNPGRYFNANTYPPEALRAGIYGRVVALLNITPAGTVEHCRIVSSAGSALNDGTCKVAMWIKFKPPLDADGKPFASTYLLPVRWVAPGSPDF